MVSFRTTFRGLGGFSLNKTVHQFHWISDSERASQALMKEAHHCNSEETVLSASYSILNQSKADMVDWYLGRYPQFKQNSIDEHGLMLEWFNLWELCSHYKGFCSLLGHITTGIYTRSLLGWTPPENQQKKAIMEKNPNNWFNHTEQSFKSTHGELN